MSFPQTVALQLCRSTVYLRLTLDYLKKGQSGFVCVFGWEKTVKTRFNRNKVQENTKLTQYLCQ